MAAKKKLVRTTGSVSKFVVPDQNLIITSEGVELTATELDQAQKAAEASNVTLVVSDAGNADDEGTVVTPDQGEGS